MLKGTCEYIRAKFRNFTNDGTKQSTSEERMQFISVLVTVSKFSPYINCMPCFMYPLFVHLIVPEVGAYTYLMQTLVLRDFCELKITRLTAKGCVQNSCIIYLRSRLLEYSLTLDKNSFQLPTMCSSPIAQIWWCTSPEKKRWWVPFLLSVLCTFLPYFLTYTLFIVY